MAHRARATFGSSTTAALGDAVFRLQLANLGGKLVHVLPHGGQSERRRFRRSAEVLPGAGAGATQARRGDQLAAAFLAATPEDCQAMPAANPTTKINSTRAKASETSFPSHELALTMAFRMVVRSRGLFDGSPVERPLENSDTAEVALEFIGIPPMVTGTAIVLKAVRFATPTCS